MEKVDYIKIGNRLKEAREDKHFTLEQAGKIAGVNKSTILRWENGETEKFKINILEKLANFYDVNPAWIMGYEVKKYNISIPENAIGITNIYEVFNQGSYKPKLDLSDLSDEEIEDVQKYIDFIKIKKQKKKD